MVVTALWIILTVLGLIVIAVIATEIKLRIRERRTRRGGKAGNPEGRSRTDN